MLRRRLAALLLVPALGAPASRAAEPAPLRLERQTLESLRADSLRGHVAFLAADRLGGRPTPSFEGDVAAEYIAAQFRRAGLEAAGDDGFFQTIAGESVTLREDGYAFAVSGSAGSAEVPPSVFRMAGPRGLRLDGVPVARVRMDALPAGLPAGTAVVVDAAGFPRGATAEAVKARREALAAIAALRPAVLVVPGQPFGAARFGRTEIVEPPPPAVVAADTSLVAIADPAVAEEVARAASAPDARLTLHVAEPERRRFTMRNVAGRLRGEGPAGREEVVLLTAHYDGTGPVPGVPGEDQVWNAANDNASGTAVVIDVAAALSTLARRPRRSVLFVAFAAEEPGLRGSAYYAGHPLAPLEKTVGALNLEQVGRTDGAQGPRKGWATITGWDYSTLPPVFARAGAEAGVRIENDPRRSEAFFARSDNLSLALAGVVSHTFSVLLDDFTDYHSPADEWPKIDYENMAKIAQAVAAGILLLADGEAPRWREDVPGARPYRDAARRSLDRAQR